MKKTLAALYLLTLSMFATSASAAVTWNLHEIERDDSNGYAVYRYGLPGKLGVMELCLKGVTEVVVLSGNAQEHEWRHKEVCPGMKVVYNVKQKVDEPLSTEFLEFFDAWVSKARAEGRKIAFRCNCGCHRTGRLAAYYQMKYQGLDPLEAIDQMYKLGYFMFLYPQLRPQVHALHDYLVGRPCAQAPQHCVR